jgi:signal transduction histidine kinase/CheY-like chemotaxis protein
MTAPRAQPPTPERWSSGAPAKPVDLDEAPLSVEDRQRILSARRIKLTLSLFVVALLLVLSAVVFAGVTRIFDWLTPTIRLDLQNKARRSVIELAQTAQIGMVVSDHGVVRAAARDYLEDPDVVGLYIVDRNGNALLAHGASVQRARAALRAPAQVLHEGQHALSAWAPSVIEGAEVGRVAIAVSTARLAAGMKLRREILVAGVASCLLALLVCLSFVNLYIGPVLRFTSDVIRRLERTTEAALTATRIKSQFLANMSHEIRTPMNGIVGVLDLMRRTPLSAKQQRYAETMETSARSLLTIVDDILDFSKIEAGKYALRTEDLSLQKLAQEVVELLAPRAHAKGIELVLHVDTAVPGSVQGDPDRLKQVLTNLVGNAIKFTERGHVVLRVEVASRSADRLTLRLAITDTGIGIAREDLHKLFGSFSQVDASLTRRFGGTGLGLAISKHLIEAMNGQVGVESQLGHGSTFWFTFETREGSSASSPEPAPRNARVLLVSADEAQRAMMRATFSRWGMACVSAEGPERASALLLEADRLPFDVAVVDGAYEVTEGFGLLDVCISEGVPVIRLVSTTQARTAEITAGANQLALVKPVRISELYDGVTSLLDGAPNLPRLRAVPPPVESPVELLRAAGANARVLVVDDNEINRTVAVELLIDLGYSAEVACDGDEAVTKAGGGGYAAILMDCQMPIMDGYEATRRIRALPGPERRVPIIALTAHAMVGDRQKVLDAGMDDYTSKPVRGRALGAVLARWVRSGSASGGSAPSVGRTESGAEPSSQP